MMESWKSRIKFIFPTLLSFLLLYSCINKEPVQTLKTEQGFALGTTYLIKYEVKNDSIDLLENIDKIFSEVNQSMSTYLPTSDISKINKGDSTIVVDENFKEVFLKAREVWENSNQKFDPTVGALVNAWGFGPEITIKKMDKKQVDSILQFTGFSKVNLTDKGNIIKTHPSVYLDFNAHAKGYTIDLIGRMFDKEGVKNYLIE